MIIYLVFLIQLVNYLSVVEIDGIIKALILIIFLIVGMAILGYAGE
jgi:hypothetical protein